MDLVVPLARKEQSGLAVVSFACKDKVGLIVPLARKEQSGLSSTLGT